VSDRYLFSQSTTLWFKIKQRYLPGFWMEFYQDQLHVRHGEFRKGGHKSLLRRRTKTEHVRAVIGYLQMLSRGKEPSKDPA
jgi:hypothetical protein